MQELVIGVDIGGSHITACLVNIREARILEDTMTRHAVDAGATAASIIRQWAAAIVACNRQLTELDIRIGIAMPGPFNYETGVSLIKGLHKYESLFGLNVKEMLAVELGISPLQIRMINDGSAYLLGEVNAGVGQGCRNIVGITLGTGLGSAWYHGGKLHEGDLYDLAFRQGKAEDLLSSRWFVRTYAEHSGREVDGVKEIAAMGNDALATEMFETFGHNLAEVLRLRYGANWPEVIVIGGNIAHAWQRFAPSLEADLGQTGHHCRICPSLLGEAAALAGASFLWK